MPLLIVCGLGIGLLGAFGAWMIFDGAIWAILLGYVLFGFLGVGAAAAFLARTATAPERKETSGVKALGESEGDRLERI